MAKRTPRQKSQLPTCYYEGYLEKRSFKDKTSRKLWASLCGNTLFFFNEKRDADYIEKLDLSGFSSITDDSSQDPKLESSRFSLQLADGNIKFTAPSAEARELWKGYICSIAELKVPSSLNLLPGQIHMLKDAVESEKERITNIPPPSAADANSSPYVCPLPACYYKVTRLEAELLLEREAKSGNLLLRPGRDGNSYAVSTRQDLNGSVFKHYRVSQTNDGGFSIDVNDPVLCASLHDVIKYLVEQTEGVLTPLIIEEAYEKRISFICSDNENGEKSVQQAASNVVTPIVPPKPAPRMKTPAPASFEENTYLNDMPEEMDEDTGETSSDAAPTQVEIKAQKKALLPPVPMPRKKGSCASSSPSSSSSTDSRDLKMKVQVDGPGQIPRAALFELKRKLELKGKCPE